MIKKQIIDYLVSNSGKLPEGETWYDVGVKFGIEAPNKERAKVDKKYEKNYIKTTTHRIWNRYIKQKNNLELTKEVYHGGKLKFETFKRVPTTDEIDFDKYEIEGITTNPHGGQWYKLRLKTQTSFSDEHLEDIKKILTSEITPVKKKPLGRKANDKALFVYGSDKHIGALTKSNSIYKNPYGREDLEERLLNEVIKTIDENVKLFGAFDSLYIMDLGDSLDGYNGKTSRGLSGRSSHSLPQALNNREQFDTYLDLHKRLFDSIVQGNYAKNIYFIATSNSNHGSDFEYTAMKTLELYLNLKYPFIKTHINVNLINHFIYGDHCIIFGHGRDDEDMKSGFPLVVNDKIESFINDYIRINKLEDYNISVVTGDLHQSSETYGKNFRYRKVLSQYGGSKWIHSNFGSVRSGLSTEVYTKNSTKIYKSDNFYELEEISNSVINF